MIHYLWWKRILFLNAVDLFVGFISGMQNMEYAFFSRRFFPEYNLSRRHFSLIQNVESKKVNQQFIVLSMHETQQLSLAVLK